MIVTELKELIGKKLILYSDKGFRYEVRILDVGEDGFVKLNDIRKLQTRYMKISSIAEWEVMENEF